MKASVKRLLFEAYRRSEMGDAQERSKPIGKRWVGLGTVAAYRPGIAAGLFMFVNDSPPSPRCMNWLVLTEKGVTALIDNIEEFVDELRRLRTDPAYNRSMQSHYSLAGGLIG
jgi:hypothetical protein